MNWHSYPARALRGAGWRVGYVRARLPRPRPAVNLAVGAIFRDEAPYLAEWVTFHRLQGVERFYLYDNLSKDDWQDALAPDLAAGVVDVTPWPEEPGQFSAYSDCLKRRRTEARWIAFIDVDEFLFSPTGRSLPDVLRAFDTHAAVAVNWRVFGSSGHETRPDDLVTTSYVTRAGDARPLNRRVKSIVHPRRTSVRVVSPHIFRHWGVRVGEEGLPIYAAETDPGSAELLRINHYISKSEEELCRKFERRMACSGRLRDPGYEGWKTLDEVRDDTILQFVPALKEALALRDQPWAVG